MYSRLTLFRNTHKLLTLSSSQHLHCDSVCALHGNNTYKPSCYKNYTCTKLIS